MSRGRRIALIVISSIGGLVCTVLIAALVVAQTQWFRDKVRAKIVTAVETSTGGKAEMESFSFNWHHLEAQIRNFTIHGLEEPGAAPLFHADRVQVNLKILSPLKGFLDVAYLLVDAPQANIIVYPDGRTNMPAPKVPAKSSNKTGLETVVDLAIGKFDLRNGSFSFGDQKTALQASGGNFRAQLSYRPLSPAYLGEIDISPLHVRTNGNAPLDVDVKLPITLAKDRIDLSNAQLNTAESHVVLSGSMDHLLAPKVTVQANVRASIEELRRSTGLTTSLDLSHGPKDLLADIDASLDQQSIRVNSAHVTLGKSAIEAAGTVPAQ